MPQSCETWFWIELIGFDVNETDCAVPALFDRGGFVPEVVSLLLHNAEFVHLHRGAEADWEFPPDVCSYGGHDHNEERRRQIWTPPALHRLVRTLQAHGTRVFFSIFDSGSPAGWREHHPELGYVLTDATRSPRICPWKRLSDGTFYEDVFVPQLRAVVRDYGFDGFHGADGWSHPKWPLHQADVSDDMVGQFMDATGESLPPELSRACDGDPAAVSRRARWLWGPKRGEWTQFHTRRIARFWQKTAGMLHDEGKELALNTCWTRDPFESIARFGVDYRALAQAGADAFIVEAAGAVQELGGDLPYGTAYGRTTDAWDPTHILCRFQTTIMTIKAAVPDTKLVFLNGIKDTNEVWNGLRHAPTNLESEITMHGNVFIRDRKGTLSRCAAGPVVCLADGIRREEWQWLSEIWERAYEWTAQRVLGAALIWSDGALEGHLEHYLSTRQCPTGRLLFELVARGAPIYTTQRVDRLEPTQDALVVLHPQLFPDADLDRVLSCAQGPLFFLGDGLPERLATDCIRTAADAGGLCCTVRGVGSDLGDTICCGGATVGTLSEEEPPSWIYEVPMRPVSNDFLQSCADAITSATDAPAVTENAESVRVWAVEDPGGTIRVFVRNDSFYYRLAQVDMRRNIRAIHVRTRFPGSAIPFSENTFRVKMPGKGVVILDVDPA